MRTKPPNRDELASEEAMPSGNFSNPSPAAIKLLKNKIMTTWINVKRLMRGAKKRNRTRPNRRNKKPAVTNQNRA